MKLKHHRKEVSRGFTLIELLVVIAIIAILAAILFPVFSRAREQARKAACMSNLKQVGLALTQYSQDYDEKYPFGYFIGGPVGNRFWWEVMQPYAKSPNILICPTAGVIESSPGVKKYSGGYGYNIGGTYVVGSTGNGFGYYSTGPQRTPNGSVLSLSEVQEPATTVMVGEPSSNSYTSAGMYLIGWTDSSYIPVLHGGQVGPFTGATVTPVPDMTGGANYLFADGHVKFMAATNMYRSSLFNVNKSDTRGVLIP